MRMGLHRKEVKNLKNSVDLGAYISSDCTKKRELGLLEPINRGKGMESV